MKRKIVNCLSWCSAYMALVLSFITTYNNDIDLTLLCLILAVIIAKDLVEKGE